jgi:hypothetical protein
MNKSMIERKLTEVGDDLKKTREELRISTEQFDHFANEAEEARIRAMVSETPIAEQEFQEASRHAETMRRHHDELIGRISELEAKQDSLLDQMMGS